jgi:hypothetical protein
MSDFSFLQKVYKLLDEGGVFDPPNDSKSLEFKQPEELKAILVLTVQSDGISDEEMEELYRTVIRYSIKFNHLKPNRKECALVESKTVKIQILRIENKGR